MYTHLRQALNHFFGFNEFRSGQAEVIDAILSGHDSLVLMPTGGGKSICYQLPASIMPGLTIVVSPLIALMKDQVDGLQRQGISAAFINSSLSQLQINQIFQDVASGKIKILYVAPERLLNRYFLEGLSSLSINFFAIDEAHCISQWGHDFRPAYTQLSQLKQLFPSTPVMALTATADVSTREDILTQLQLNNPFITLDSFDRPNIRLTLAEKYQGEHQLYRYVKSQHENNGIVYCNSRWQVEKIAAMLAEKGINCAAYHAGLEPEIRQMVQEQFTKDKLQIVVATIAFGLGINKPNIRFVVHYECPRTLESYYQEIGRAGRDGLPAEALLLFNDADSEKIKKRILTNDNEQRIQVESQRFQAMIGFAEAQTCRRQVLLNYFAQYTHEKCNNCDICLDPPSEFNGLEPAQKVLSCVYRIKQQGDIQLVMDVLRGEKTSQIISSSFDTVSTFGIGKDKMPGYWFAIIRQLIHKGFLQQDISNQSRLCLTSASKDVLQSSSPLMLATPRLQKATYWRKDNMTNPLDKPLFSKLRELRKTIADAEDIAPYIIFNDATLSELARKKPVSSRQMLAISGIGDVKLSRYGQPFLSLIKEHAQLN